MSRILITGKNGQLGYELARAFADWEGVEVVALDRAAFDLTKPDQMRATIRRLAPSLIVNAAAYTAVDHAEEEPALAMAVNGIAPAILAEEANRCGAGLVHYSTDYVFAGDGRTPYRETDPVAPSSVYGRTKLAGELAVASIAHAHLIVRTAWLYSNRRHNFLLTVLRLAREREMLGIVDDQRGSPTWVREVSRATRAMLQVANGAVCIGVPSGVYHVAARGETTWHAFASRIVESTHDPARKATAVNAISSADYRAAARRPAYSVLATNKLAAQGITLPDWETQLTACLAERATLAPEPAPDATAASAPIHLFVPTFEVDACLAGIRECLEKGWTGLGYKTLAFEEAWKEYTGLPHAHFLNSATVGLHLAVEVLKRQRGWADGDEIVTTPLTFVSDSHTILYAGLRPVFADVDDTLCLDPADVARKIGPRTRAVMFVGMGGNPGRYAEVLALCRARGLALILDAAHMAGTRSGVPLRHVGHDADVAVFSFQAVKNLPTADAGMICFADARDDEIARKLTWMGINKDTYARTAAQGEYKWLYDVEFVGYKYHGNSIMAAIALAQLPVLDAGNAIRRRLAARYRAGFAPHGHIRMVAVAEPQHSATHLFQIRVDRRDDVMVALNRAGIYPGVHYRDNTLYRMYAYADGTCPAARRASEEIVSLPLHLRLSDADVDRVIATILKATAA